MKAEPHSTDRAAAKKRKGPTERDLIVREARCQEDLAEIVGWLVQCSLDALEGREDTPPPDGMRWLSVLRYRAEAQIEADEAAHGDSPDPDDDPQISELWRLLRCLTLLEKRMHQRTEDLIDQAASIRPGRRRKPAPIRNALAGPNALLASMPPKQKEKAKPGRKRKLPITSEELLAEFGHRPCRTGQPERDRLAEFVRRRIPDVRRSTGRSAEQHAETLAKRLAEARREFRNRAGNAGHSERQL